MLAANADPQLHHIRNYIYPHQPIRQLPPNLIPCVCNHLHTLIENKNIDLVKKLINYDWQRQYEPLLKAHFPEDLCYIFKDFLHEIEDVPLRVPFCQKGQYKQLAKIETLLSLSIRTNQLEAITLFLQLGLNPLKSEIRLESEVLPKTGLLPKNAIEVCLGLADSASPSVHPSRLEIQSNILKTLNTSRYITSGA